MTFKSLFKVNISATRYLYTLLNLCLFGKWIFFHVDIICISPCRKYLSSTNDIIFVQKETAEERKSVFENDYSARRNSGGYDNDTVCGFGSYKEHTREMIQMLHSITDLLKVELGKDSISFLDSSCGDMFWMPEFLEQRSDVKYTGYDQADGNIASNRDKQRLVIQGK